MFKANLTYLLAIAVGVGACGASQSDVDTPVVQQNGLVGESVNASCLDNPQAAWDPQCNQSPSSANQQFCFTEQNCIPNTTFSPVVTPNLGGLCACPAGQELIFNPDGLASCHTIVRQRTLDFFLTYRFRGDHNDHHDNDDHDDDDHDDDDNHSGGHPGGGGGQAGGGRPGGGGGQAGGGRPSGGGGQAGGGRPSGSWGQNRMTPGAMSQGRRGQGGNGQGNWGQGGNGQGNWGQGGNGQGNWGQGGNGQGNWGQGGNGQGSRGQGRHGNGGNDRFAFELNAGTFTQQQINDAGACNQFAKQLCTPGLPIDECSAQSGNGAVRCIPVPGGNYGFCGIPY